MLIKSFSGPTMTEIMATVRDDLGDDAIIVTTRELPEGGMRVTAAIDDSAATAIKPAGTPDDETDGPGQTIPTPIAAPHPALAFIENEPDFETGVAAGAYGALLDHGTPNRLAQRIAAKVDELEVERLSENGRPARPIQALRSGLEAIFGFQTPAELWSDKPLMMVGPHGTGKTLALAKIAARSVMRGLRPYVITTDVVRAGAVEQLEAFTRIMNIDLATADEPGDLKKLLKRVPEDTHQILIDTAASNPFDAAEMELLADMVQHANAEPLLVLAAGADALEAGSVATGFRSIGARHLICTRLDATARFGSLLAAADLGRLNFAYLSQSATVTSGLREASAEQLAEMLIVRGHEQVPETGAA